ncbi:23S rRNA pseudouridine955/2504/2580 synthase [Reichenbachiella faecimaris]|uniref:23S rRNA pseudouridine955/2504/2580 synthase n=1 Tax=Reichenbachiella faecimaris TaxID=692418 RepID=A0A1W2G9H8_REIFA|nr:RNA pseudouridine synthase [Reichenbachiella faecimaris]SMD33008.1 23S rRNA pseudouridine955/2504/2580 synthase [Reichenbachiella faecimaris]
MKKNVWKAEDMVVYDDDDYTIINKPPHLSTLEDRNDSANVLSLFRALDNNYQVCHRLDKETSGALLLAKNDQAYKVAALQFQEREVEKVYHALVKGRFMNEVIQVDVPLRTSGSGRVICDKRSGKEAVTLLRPKQFFKDYTLVEAKPVTGRTHQIRVHLAYLNFPICGDDLYGGEPIFLSSIKKGFKSKREHEERPLFSRVGLHAHSIKLTNVNKNIISHSCNYPKDMKVIIEKLNKFN